MIRKQTIAEFLEELSSKSPTPGGGAVAAITGATAAALTEMVVNLTKDPTTLRPVGERAKTIKEDLLKLADSDVTAFDAVMAAYRSKDKQAIKEALRGAIKVPEETKKLSEEVERLAKEVAEKGNKNAVSDARTAIYLAQAAQKSAQENIEINRQSLAGLE